MFRFFLERVLSEEGENVKGGHGLLIMAVHAVMLESGFLGFDPRANKGVRGFGLPQGWESKGLVRLRYTLPELVDVNGNSKSVENVELKFEVMGNFLVVFGSQQRRHSLEVGKYLPSLEDAIRDNLSSKTESQNPYEIGESSCNKESQNVGETLKTIGGDLNLPTVVKTSDSSVHERVLFELWRVVKDRLCMPVLSALCEKTGLPLPPSLIMLPTELKMKILEALPAVDVAKVGCLCTEFRFLCAYDELWEQKYLSEFGSPSPFVVTRSWKNAFVKIWESRKFLSRPSMHSPFGGLGFYVWGEDFDRFAAAISGGNL